MDKEVIYKGSDEEKVKKGPLIVGDEISDGDTIVWYSEVEIYGKRAYYLGTPEGFAKFKRRLVQ